MRLDFDAFLNSFLNCALWATGNDDGESIASTHSVTDIHIEAGMKLRQAARVWWLNNKRVLQQIVDENGMYVNGYMIDEMAGNDLWLTMNGHGAGFWDRDFYKCHNRKGELIDHKDIFTKHAEFIGGLELYVGDDGLIYI